MELEFDDDVEEEEELFEPLVLSIILFLISGFTVEEPSTGRN